MTSGSPLDAPRAPQLHELPAQQVRHRLADAGLVLCTGPLTFQIRSQLPDVAAGLLLHYGTHPVLGEDAFVDCAVTVRRPHNHRRFVRPQVLFEVDRYLPFLPMPGNQGYPLLEWGMNWCITTRMHHWVTVHAGVLERDGRALVMPAPPGSGKSTLCAALCLRGWRLLSDELALIDPDTGLVVPIPRPVSLKNASIDVIQAFEPTAVMNPPVFETSKGTVAHLRPPPESVARASETARPGWVVLPKYRTGAATSATPLPRSEAMLHLAHQCFNYSIHGVQGFNTLCNWVAGSDCWRFEYSRLDEAVAWFEQL